MQRQLVDAEARIDGFQTLGEQAADVIGIMGCLTRADLETFDIAVHPKNQERQPLHALACLVEPPAKFLGEMGERVNQGWQLDDRLQKALLGAVNRWRAARAERFLLPGESLIEAQQHRLTHLLRGEPFA